jgi:enamine deaminase RidA (YjgF/YER057c/UK114 family)
MDAQTKSLPKILQPEDWPRPKGYANGISVSGRLVITAGLVGWDKNGRFGKSFVEQFRQTLMNIVEVLREGQARPEHIVRMTWYIVDRDQYLNSLREIGSVYREIIGKVFPAMAVVQISGLVEPEALLEIETLAVVPE